MSRQKRKIGSKKVLRERAGGWWPQRLSPRGSGVRARGCLVDTDFAKQERRDDRWQRIATPLAVLGVFAALGLTGLRNDIVRMEYDLTEAGKLEQQLLDRQRRLTVEHRKLLAPARLYEIAGRRGFVRPARVIDLDIPVDRAAPTPIEIATRLELRP